ncbi:MAG: serine protease [Rickettsiales bacterium]|nr:serine protease [Rickettsiales bacterium]
MQTLVSHGSGFYIHPQGFVLSNLHVVEHCDDIVLNGPVLNAPATIAARDSEHDLVVLKTAPISSEALSLRDPSVVMEPGERALVLGYPSAMRQKDKMIAKEAQIEAISGPQGEDKWLQISNVVAKGNSGGPLMDRAGHVAGVVAAQAVVYTYQMDQPENGTTRRSGIAVTVPTIQSFLDKNDIPYQLSDTQTYFPLQRLADKARQQVVSVRCDYRTEIR